ncbi:MAG: DHHA1 domain-containing protein, partial [Lachnospiraceae bacterium]
IYVSARSLEDINVQRIMERLGGGGHLTTAGAQLSGCTVEEARKLIHDTIDQMEEEGEL